MMKINFLSSCNKGRALLSFAVSEEYLVLWSELLSTIPCLTEQCNLGNISVNVALNSMCCVFAFVPLGDL